MMDKGFSILASIVVLATITVLVASKNNTANVASAGFTGFGGLISKAMGN
jgi:hypothetical protein